MSQLEIAIIASIPSVLLGFLLGVFSKNFEIKLQARHVAATEFRNLFIKLRDKIIREDFGDDNSIGTFISKNIDETNLAFDIFIGNIPKCKQRRIKKAYYKYQYPRGKNNFHIIA